MPKKHKDWCSTQVPLVKGQIAERGPCNCGASTKVGKNRAQPSRKERLYRIIRGTLYAKTPPSISAHQLEEIITQLVEDIIRLDTFETVH